MAGSLQTGLTCTTANWRTLWCHFQDNNAVQPLVHCNDYCVTWYVFLNVFYAWFDDCVNYYMWPSLIPVFCLSIPYRPPILLLWVGEVQVWVGHMVRMRFCSGTRWNPTTLGCTPVGPSRHLSHAWLVIPLDAWARGYWLLALITATRKPQVCN